MSPARTSTRTARRLLSAAAVVAVAAVGTGVMSTTSATAAKPVLDPLTGVKVASLGSLVAIKVSNQPPARPQSGLRSADQVWVEEQEGGWTRFIALYGSSYPTKVGPVRSGRETDLGVLPQFGKVGLAYAGADADVVHLISSDTRVVDLGKDATVNGTLVRTSTYFTDKTRKIPYNFYAKANAARNFAKAGGGTTARPMGFTFGKPKVAGTRTSSLNVVWATQTSMQATWNKKLNAWVLYADGKAGRLGKPLLDRESKKVLTAKNIVVMRVRYTLSKLDNSLYPVPILSAVGKGAVTVLRDGARWTGTWSRASLTRGTALRDAKGHVITLTPGQTWVMLVPIGRSLNKPYVLHSVTTR